MIEKIHPKQFLYQSATMPVLDVRSPVEFAQGHIPDAFNLPLFDDDERALIGTLYKKSGRETSLLKGLDITGPKLSGFVKKANRIAPKKSLLLHCWRGGMRSESIAWLLSMAGFEVFLLEGGYKAYRHYIREEISLLGKYIILGGDTGSGKTEILEIFHSKGEQVLNLEKIAHHKGSAFGHIGEMAQPTNEQFENDLFKEWNLLDHTHHTWVEDESRSVGNVFIPDPLYNQMQNSKIIKVQLSKEHRIRRLVDEYSGFPPEMLKKAVVKISRRMGRQNVTITMQAIDEENFEKAVGTILFYYDKVYDFGIKKHESNKVFTFVTETPDAFANAEKILEFIKETIEV
jgi:tRNA 2-selenouridine synthase